MIYYISLYNEPLDEHIRAGCDSLHVRNHPMPEIPSDPLWKEHMLKGLYQFRPAKEGMAQTVRLRSS